MYLALYHVITDDCNSEFACNTEALDGVLSSDELLTDSDSMQVIIDSDIVSIIYPGKHMRGKLF